MIVFKEKYSDSLLYAGFTLDKKTWHNRDLKSPLWFTFYCKSVTDCFLWLEIHSLDVSSNGIKTDFWFLDNYVVALVFSLTSQNKSNKETL